MAFRKELTMIYELLGKYDVKVLNDSEVNELNLNEFNNNVLNASMSLAELEEIIINYLQQGPIILNNDVYLDINNDIGDIKKTKMFNVYSRNTIDEIRRETETYSTESYPYDVSAIMSVAATYEYRYIKYPIGPPEIANKHFIIHH